MRRPITPAAQAGAPGEPATPQEARPARPGGQRGCAALRRVRPSRSIFLYLLKGIAVNSLIAFLVLEAVWGILVTIRATEKVTFEILIIFPVLLRAFAQSMGLMIPVSLLFGASLFVGRLNADREALALRSFGISPLQLLSPVLLLGGVLSLPALQLNTQWVPEVRFENRNAESLILDRIGYLGEGWNFEYTTREMSLWVNHYDGPKLEGIFVGRGTEGAGVLVSEDVLKRLHAQSYPVYFFAERGTAAHGTGAYAGRLVFVLEGVSLFFDHEIVKQYGRRIHGQGVSAKEAALAGAGNEGFMHRMYMERITWPIGFAKKTPGSKDLNRAELAQETARRLEALEQARAQGDPRKVREAESYYLGAISEFHRRLALTFSVLSFPLTAFLFGLWVRSSNRLLPFFLASAAVPALFFAFDLLGNAIAKQGYAPWAARELGNIVLCALDSFFLWRIYGAPRG